MSILSSLEHILFNKIISELYKKELSTDSQ
jgi:hypothetical protein